MERSPYGKLTRVNTGDRVAGLLRDRILSGELPPGTPLPEVQVSESIGISRNTLREALRILVHEGLVEHAVHRGAAVASLDPESIDSIFGARRVIELAAVDALEGREAEAAETLLAVADSLEMAGAEDDALRVVELDLEFHVALVRFLDSNRLSEFHRKLVRELRLGLVLVDRAQADLAAAGEEHRRLAQLLADRDLRGFRRELRAHLEASAERLRAVVGDDAGPPEPAQD